MSRAGLIFLGMAVVGVLGCHVISIVSARRPTPYGNQLAGRLARDWRIAAW